jgi:hypothetical protein
VYLLVVDTTMEVAAYARPSDNSVGISMQLLTKPREEVLAPFIPEPFRGWRKAVSYGNHLKWDGDLLLDFSPVFANGAFPEIFIPV